MLRTTSTAAVFTVIILAQVPEEAEARIRRNRQVEITAPTADVKKRLALDYYLLRQTKLFEQRMKEAAALAPLDADPPYYLGRFYLAEREDKSLALMWLQRALELAPTRPRVLNALAEVFEKDGRCDQASKLYETALAQRKNGLSYEGLARCALQEGDAPRARDEAEKALTLEPTGGGHWLLGQALLKLKAWERAERELDQAARLLPHEAGIHFQRARALDQLGRKKEAEASRQLWRETAELLGKPVTTDGNGSGGNETNPWP